MGKPALPALFAQPLDRLYGKVVSDRGDAIKDADVRVEALFGFAGGAYLGQRTFATKSDAKGNWALLGFKSGIWVFEASPPDRSRTPSPCHSISSHRQELD